MANIFTITTVAQTLKADASGSVTTVFTVTNSTSRPIRGIARIKPLGNTASSWIRIEGETERDFPAGGTHQFTVNFNKPKPPTPPNTPQPAESFPFRLDAASATNPDEDFTEGAVVTVEVAGQVVDGGKPFPWWILIVLGVLLLIGAIVTFLLSRNGGDENISNTSNTAKPTLTPTPTPIPIKMSAKEYGSDRPGGDYNSFYVATVQDCENICKEDVNCNAYTFGHPPTYSNYCWLKKSIPEKKYNASTISGYKIKE